MLIVKYRLATGETGEDVVLAGDKWTFGRPDGDEVPTVPTTDRRISRGALVVRDSGPGPVIFRGQRGEQAAVGLVSTSGSTQWLDEGTAGHLSADARRVEMSLADEPVITLEIDFADRGSVVERRDRHRPHLTVVPEPSEG